MWIRRGIVISVLFALITGCTQTEVRSGGETENLSKTESLYKEFIKGEDTAQLNLFFTEMPKGGDLHHHYSGSIYAETYLEWARERGERIDRETLKGGGDGVTVEELQRDNDLYRRLLSLWSDKDYDNHYHQQDPPDAHFFNTFGYFGSVSKTDEEELRKGLENLKERAVEENVLYIETMLKTIKYPRDESQIEARIAGYDEELRRSSSITDREELLGKISEEIEEELRRLSSLGPDYEDPIEEFIGRVERAHEGIDDENFMMRYQTYASRNSSPTKVFLTLYSAFKAAEESELLVGVNIVGPENGVVAIEDYTLHMQMFGYLKRRFPDVRRALHAGELVLGMVPPEDLKFHIREAVEVAGAQRIGHGVDISYEEGAVDLLERMKDKAVVEINLTSNEFILGVEGREHPYIIYKAAQVPMVISTDDSGVSRNNLTREYVLLASRYKPSYGEIKEYVYNSIIHSFLSEEERDVVLARLDLRFTEFEEEMAGYYDLIYEDE